MEGKSVRAATRRLYRQFRAAGAGFILAHQLAKMAIRGQSAPERFTRLGFESLGTRRLGCECECYEHVYRLGELVVTSTFHAERR